MCVCVCVLQSPPYAVTEEKRREAEGIFLDLKKAKLPYNTCKFILGMGKFLCIYIVCDPHNS